MSDDNDDSNHGEDDDNDDGDDDYDEADDYYYDISDTVWLKTTLKCLEKKLMNSMMKLCYVWF